MPRAELRQSTEPLPRYAMPNESEPEYDLILEELHKDRHSQVGRAFFYIKSDEDGCALCRIMHGGGKIYFHEIIDHRKHGIADEDIELSARMDPQAFALPGHYHISPLVEKKLRALFEFP